jgi:hypothetical protein
MRLALCLVATACALSGVPAQLHALSSRSDVARVQSGATPRERKKKERPELPGFKDDEAVAPAAAGGSCANRSFTPRVAWASLTCPPLLAPPALPLTELTKPDSLRFFLLGTPLNRRAPPA